MTSATPVAGPAGDSVPLVRVSTDGGVMTVTLDSPANRNALSRRLVAELTDALQAADGADDVRVVVLTHTGGTFCAGADLSEAMAHGMEEGTRSLLGVLRQIVALSTPVVAVVRGHCRAGGVGLVGACDVVLAGEQARFAFTESLLGLAPAIISLTTSSRLQDRDAALKYLTGEVFGADEAARSGLVTRSVADADLDDALDDVLLALRKASPQGLRETKALLSRPVLERIDTDGDAMVELSARLFGSEEAREGMMAFQQKRKPRWAN
jgi:enoyl-CoA hydratase